MGMHKEQLPQRTKVYIMQSEYGCGSRVDDVLYFDTLKEAHEYVNNFNSKNDLKQTPDWYMYAVIV